MKYFIDTEFHEGFHKPLLFGMNRHFIDLISIGIVDENGRGFYAISNEFDIKAAWNSYQLEMVSGDMRNIFPEGKKVYWLRENVLRPIFEELHHRFVREDDYKGSVDMKFNYDNFSYLIKKYGESNEQIAEEIVKFIDARYIDDSDPSRGLIYPDGNYTKPFKVCTTDIEFYGYYCDYDWVAFCALFGKMIDLPKGFPMYCKDLKQMLDGKIMEEAIGVDKALKNSVYPIPDADRKPMPKLFEEMLQDYKNVKEYPKQTNEHNALADAKWNRKLYDFINII